VSFSSGQVGKTDFTDYRILGDDLVIGNYDVYRKVLDNLATIGVQVSVNKCTKGRNQSEMAKRLFHKGEEVSPLPLALLARMPNSPSLVIDFLIHLQQRGKKFSLNSLLDLA